MKAKFKKFGVLLGEVVLLVSGMNFVFQDPYRDFTPESVMGLLFVGVVLWRWFIRKQQKQTPIKLKSSSSKEFDFNHILHDLSIATKKKRQ